MGTPFKMKGVGLETRQLNRLAKAMRSLRQTGKKLMMNTRNLRAKGTLKDSIEGMANLH
jgi:hypothetical protein